MSMSESTFLLVLGEMHVTNSSYLFSRAEDTLMPQHSLEGKCGKGDIGKLNKHQHGWNGLYMRSFLGGAMHPFGEGRAVRGIYPTIPCHYISQHHP